MSPEQLKALEAFPLWFQIVASLCFGFVVSLWHLRGYLNREKPNKIEPASESINNETTGEMMDLMRMELSRIASAVENLVSIKLRDQYRQLRAKEFEKAAQERAEQILREREK